MNQLAMTAGLLMMSRALLLAQTQVIVPPTNTYWLEWDSPDGGGAPASYELRYSTSGTYVGLGNPNPRRASLPNLADGSYTAQLRACNAVGCSEPASIMFTVRKNVTSAPAGTPTALRLMGPSTAAATAERLTAAPAQRLLFSNGWDARDETGCTWSGIVDALYDATHPAPATATSWTDFGLVDVCKDPPEVEVDAVQKHDGMRSLRVTHSAGAATDFRVVKTFSTVPQEVTILVFMRFDEGYSWGTSGEHRNIVLMNGDENVISLNHRATTVAARWSLTIKDAAFTDLEHVVPLGQWMRVRMHLRSGVHGLVEVFVQPEGGAEVKLSASQGDLTVPTFTTLKLSTTRPQAAETSLRWFDSVSVYGF